MVSSLHSFALQAAHRQKLLYSRCLLFGIRSPLSYFFRYIQSAQQLINGYARNAGDMLPQSN